MKMKYLTKKPIISLILILTMIFNIVPFGAFTVYAEENEIKITFRLDSATVSGNVITFDVDGTEITATAVGTGYTFNGNNLEINESDLNNVKLALSNNFDSSKMSLKLHDGQTLIVTGDNEAIFDGLDFSNDNAPHLQIIFTNGGEQHGGEQHGGDNTQNYQGNAVSTLNYKIVGAIEYGYGGGFDHGISFRINDIPYAADESKMQYSEDIAYERDENGQLILDENNNPIVVKDPETMQPITEKTGLTINGDTINYDYNTETNKVKFTFAMAPGTLMTGLKINDKIITNLPSTKEELADCYIDHRLEIDVDNIDKAEIYNIEITARYPNSNEEFLGNFLWDYNPQGYTGPDDKILNATLTFVEAEYNEYKYTTEEEINSLGTNALAHRNLQRRYPYLFITSNALIVKDGVQVYEKLFFDKDSDKKALVKRLQVKYGYLPAGDEKHPPTKLANQVKGLSVK